MLDDDIKQQLAAYLERVQQPFEMVATLGSDDKSTEMRELLEEIAGMRPDKITLRTDGTDARVPSFSLNRVGSDTKLRFAAGSCRAHAVSSPLARCRWLRADQTMLGLQRHWF